MPHNPEKDRQRAQRTRELLLQAGKEVMAPARAEEVTVREVVSRAGVSVGTFYNHFADIESFRREVIFVTFKQLRELSREERGFHSDEPIVDPVERIRKVNRLFFDFLENNRTEVLLLMGQWSQVGPHADEIEEQVAGAIADIAADIGRAQALGLARPELDAELAAEAIRAVNLHFGRLYLARTDSSDLAPSAKKKLRHQMADIATDLFLLGVASDLARSLSPT